MRLICLTAIAAALCLPAVAADRAGLARKVQPASYQDQGGYPFNLATGDEIFRQANVFTRELGSLQILFDDGSDLTLGPNSDIVIDDYVYDPHRGTGETAISLTRGALRMISGRMPKGGMAVRTPVATIGVRGTDFTLQTRAGGELAVWVEQGVIVAAPIATDQTFTFTAPARGICTASGCTFVDPGEQPVSFPTPGGGDSGGPNDGDEADNDDD